MKFATLFLAVLLLVSCKPKQTTQEAKLSPEEQKREEEIMKAGYSKGTMVDNSKLDGCGFMIQLEDQDQTLLWPTKLEDRFKKEGTKVWVKYTPSKMMSTCMKGIPAIIEEIKIIE